MKSGPAQQSSNQFSQDWLFQWFLKPYYLHLSLMKHQKYRQKESSLNSFFALCKSIKGDQCVM